MPVTYSQLARQIDNALGNIKGMTIAIAEANYTAAATTANRLNPDYPPSAVQDAIVTTIMEIVEAIAKTKYHPERVDFTKDTAALANRATLPALAADATPLLGLMGSVRDSASNKTLLPLPLDEVRSYNEFSSTVYAGLAKYWYAIGEGGATIEHTRTNVILKWPAYARPTYAAGSAIALRDHHEPFIVAGAVVKLALKEITYAELVAPNVQKFGGWLQQIALIGSAEASGLVSSAAVNV